MNVFLFATTALAVDYAFPTSEEDYGEFYPTAYKDHATSSAVEDWNCGDLSYDGHTGNDFGAGSFSGMDEGRDVTAAADGLVIATNDGEYDRCTTGDCGDANYVKILHADGRTTLYYHLKKWSVLVSEGQYVQCGEKLGLMGSSGNSYGPHVHFGVVGTAGDNQDPFAGRCSSGTDYWVEQGSYGDLPERTCDPDAPAFSPTEALIALTHDDQESTDVDGDGDADLCLRADTGVRCALGGDDGPSGTWVSALAASDQTLPADQMLTLRWGDLNGDRRDDACIRTSTDYRCFLSEGDRFATSPVPGAPGWSDTLGFTRPTQYATLRMLDLDGDGRQDLCARDADGIVCVRSDGRGFGAPFRGPAWSDADGWDDPANASTLRAGDINGDGRDDLCARANTGILCVRSTGDGFEATPVSGPAWSDDAGWDSAVSYGTLRLADLDGDGRADLFGRGPEGVVFSLATEDGFAEVRSGPIWSDDSGWADPSNAFTLRLGDIDGDGRVDLCGRANAGIRCVLWADGYGTGSFVGPTWSDDAGWDLPAQYWSIRLADVTGDGRADLCGRAPEGLVCAASLGDHFGDPVPVGWGTDAEGYGGDDNWPLVMAGGPHATGCSDRDGDRVCDDADGCPDNSQKSEADACGCSDASCDDDGLPGVPVALGDGCGCTGVSGPPSWAAVASLMALVFRWRKTQDGRRGPAPGRSGRRMG